jgi:hypothetical protein
MRPGRSAGRACASGVEQEPSSRLGLVESSPQQACAASWALATRSTRPEVLHCSQQVHPSHSKARQARQSLAAYVRTMAGIEENLVASRGPWLTGFHERRLFGSMDSSIASSPRSNGERIHQCRMRRRPLHRLRSDRWAPQWWQKALCTKRSLTRKETTDECS